MVLKRAKAAGVQRKGINKLTLGFAGIATAAVIGTTGLVAAQTPMANTGKPSKAQCAQMGFTNYGQCVSQWAKHHGQQGHGYGGNTANVSVNVHQGGSHNVVNIILNLFQ